MEINTFLSKAKGKYKRLKWVIDRRVDYRTRELHAKNKHLTESIRYAKRIQQAILPDKNLIEKNLPFSFILEKPKDIVSGDFYWFAKVQQSQNPFSKPVLIIAVADCTGHGVPGALMSMLGHALLNSIVNEKGFTNPAEILSELHKAIRISLKQTEEQAEVADGMDISICRIDLDNKQLIFSGANRPLYLFEGEEFSEIKGDNYGIGGTMIGKERIYTNHDFNLKKNTRIYLSSDGYADQFGGSKDKKISTKRFKQVLGEVQFMKMPVQHQYLDNFFDNWKKNTEQIDDVLVMGIDFGNI